MAFKSLVFLTLFPLLISCGESTNNGSGSWTIPAVSFFCNPAFASDCSSAAGSSKTVYIGLTDDLSNNCSDLFLGISNSLLSFSFVAFGSTTSSFTNGGQSGSVNSWVDRTGATVFFLDLVDHKACSFLDTDSDGVFDATEPVGALTVAPNTTAPNITDWF